MTDLLVNSQEAVGSSPASSTSRTPSPMHRHRPEVESGVEAVAALVASAGATSLGDQSIAPALFSGHVRWTAGLVVTISLLLSSPLASATRNTSKSNYYEFRTPSGNIVCAAGWTARSGSVQCWLLSTGDLGRGVYPYAWYLPARGRVSRSRPGDRPGRGHLLVYGSIWRGGPLSCESRTSGLRCRSSLTGRGFFLSREVQRVF